MGTSSKQGVSNFVQFFSLFQFLFIFLPSAFFSFLLAVLIAKYTINGLLLFFFFPKERTGWIWYQGQLIFKGHLYQLMLQRDPMHKNWYVQILIIADYYCSGVIKIWSSSCIFLWVNLIYTDSVYTITVEFMTHVQELEFKFKFYIVVIHSKLTVYTVNIGINLLSLQTALAVKGDAKLALSLFFFFFFFFVTLFFSSFRCHLL